MRRHCVTMARRALANGREIQWARSIELLHHPHSEVFVAESFLAYKTRASRGVFLPQKPGVEAHASRALPDTN